LPSPRRPPATETTVADAFDQAVLEAAAEPAADTAEPAIRSGDAIIAEVNQIAVIIVTGDAETAIEEPAEELLAAFERSQEIFEGNLARILQERV
jgi:hypothetical protein